MLEEIERDESEIKEPYYGVYTNGKTRERITIMMKIMMMRNMKMKRIDCYLYIVIIFLIWLFDFKKDE